MLLDSGFARCAGLTAALGGRATGDVDCVALHEPDLGLQGSWACYSVLSLDNIQWQGWEEMCCLGLRIMILGFRDAAHHQTTLKNQSQRKTMWISPKVAENVL